MDQMIYRYLQEDEAQKFWNMMYQLDFETKFMMYEPGEREQTRQDMEQIKTQIRDAAAGKDFLMIAEADGQIVGYIAAQRGIPNRIRHTAYIVTGVRAAYRGRGIGRTFFKMLDDWAVKNGIKRLELTVLCANETAKRLYESNGFAVEGVRVKSMLVDGCYEDEFYLAKIL